MKIDFIWIIAATLNFVLTYLIAKYIGAQRQIGYTKSIFWSILLSPIIGFFIAFSSPKIEYKSV